MQSDDLDPIDARLRDALSADSAAARRLARQALEPSSRKRVPVLLPVAAALFFVVAVLGLVRDRPDEPSMVIRAEAGEIILERGTSPNKTVERIRDRPPAGGIVVIREGGS